MATSREKRGTRWRGQGGRGREEEGGGGGKREREWRGDAGQSDGRRGMGGKVKECRVTEMTLQAGGDNQNNQMLPQGQIK